MSPLRLVPLALTAVALLQSPEPMAAAQAIDPGLLGQWTSVQVSVVSHTPLDGKGWSDFAAALTRSTDYEITLAATGSEVQLAFPGGPRNMLTSVGYTLDALPRTVVLDRGGWWSTYQTQGESSAQALKLSSTIYSDWTLPDPVSRRPKPTDFLARFDLELEGPDRLVLRARLVDEKGAIEYTQRFRRRS